MFDKRQQFTFVWGFTGGDAVTVVACQPITLFVDRDAENGSATQSVPPYTMIAYPESGIPTVDLLGNGPTNIPWTPRFQPGTKVLLNVVDSLGNSGGVAQVLYTVGAGTSTSCVPAASNSDMTINVQASGTMNTCDTVPIQIQGGSAPYKVTVAVTNASAALNTTMTGQNNLFQWVERADPNQSLIIAVSDSNGQYAPTSSFFTTGGTTDKTCSGKVDSQTVAGGVTNSASSPPSRTSGQTTASASQTSQAPTPVKGSNLTGPIIGTIVALLVVLGLVAFWFFRRQKTRSYDGASMLGGGFGMKDYKRGGNMQGNDSFVPLHDGASPSAPRTPLYTDVQSPPHTISNSLSGLGSSGAGSSGAGSNRPVSGYEYYSSPPSNYSGTVDTSGPSRMGTLSSQMGLGVGAAAAGVAGSTASSGAMSKRQMALEERQRNQRWRGSGNPPPAPESVYPPPSNYTANPFADPAQPYRPPAPPSAVESQRAPPSTFDPVAQYGNSAYGVTPATYQPSHAASRAGGSQDTTTSAARAKAAEAAREREQTRQLPPVDDEDEEPIPYMQRVRPVLGVTNPDRASTATSNSGVNDPYGGMDRSRPSTQVYQHEDAGVIELPPAYREFSNATPGPGQPRQ